MDGATKFVIIPIKINNPVATATSSGFFAPKSELLACPKIYQSAFAL
jgi:hypothetical protein